MRIQIGDRVRFSVEYLKARHEHPTSHWSYAEGEVVGTYGHGHRSQAIVSWDHGFRREEAVRILCSNLAHVGSLAATSEDR